MRPTMLLESDGNHGLVGVDPDKAGECVRRAVSLRKDDPGVRAFRAFSVGVTRKLLRAEVYVPNDDEVSDLDAWRRDVIEKLSAIARAVVGPKEET